MMYDLFIQLGIVYFTIEILHRLFDAYIIISLRIAMWRHDEYCEDCAEQELINEIRKK